MRIKARSKLSKEIHDPSGLFRIRVVNDKKKYSRKGRKNVEKDFSFSYDYTHNLRDRLFT